MAVKPKRGQVTMDTRALQSISDKRRFRTLHRDATRTVPAAARSTSLCHKAKEGPSQIKQRSSFPSRKREKCPAFVPPKRLHGRSLSLSDRVGGRHQRRDHEELWNESVVWSSPLWHISMTPSIREGVGTRKGLRKEHVCVSVSAWEGRSRRGRQ